MKVLGTNVILYGNILYKARELSADIHNSQYRIICGCKSRADANRQCAAAGLGDRVFQPDYTSETGNDKELNIAGQGGIFVKVNNGPMHRTYISIEELKGE